MTLPGNIAAVFPAGDRLALAVVSLCIAANDVEDAAKRAAEANPQDHPDPDVAHRRRFYYLVRVAQGHLFEAIHTLRAWEGDEPELRKLMQNLDEDARRDRRMVLGLEQKLGSKALKGVRQHTFHYPHPDAGKKPDSTVALAEVIEREGELPAAVDLSEDARAKFRFADQLALALAMKDFDEDQAKAQVCAVLKGAGAFARLVTDVYFAYCEKRKIGFDVVD